LAKLGKKLAKKIAFSIDPCLRQRNTTFAFQQVRRLFAAQAWKSSIERDLKRKTVKMKFFLLFEVKMKFFFV
jgi:hypothetical protein